MQSSDPDEWIRGENLFKFVILGDEAVGKSCLLWQFIDGSFRTHHKVTVGVEFASKVVTVFGKKIKLQCWDTAGLLRYRNLIRTYFPDSHGALLVYDITRRDSFATAEEMLQTLREKAADTDLIVTLVGNKCEQVTEREVSHEEAYNFAQRMDLHFVEVSALTRHMLDEAFLSTAKLTYLKRCVAEVIVLCNLSHGLMICSSLAGEQIGEFEVPSDEPPYGSWLVNHVYRTMRMPELQLSLVGSDGQIFWNGLVQQAADDKAENQENATVASWDTCCVL
eukprot:TRINITY_DN395_c0_g1_i1.p1 TRINITY_DN395_c0_g1~~TRINITY_DN395_c0_g1_i1.p1  ORF type:complete len:279 (-),score=53.89 TRINITY_DN395_c0_g1_i1:246-1082(-)